MRIQYSKTLKNNPLRVTTTTGQVTVNAEMWARMPEEIKYFYLRWAFHVYNFKGVLLVADEKAAKDYIEMGYSKKLLLRWFLKLGKSTPIDINKNRMVAMIATTIKYKSL